MPEALDLEPAEAIREIQALQRFDATLRARTTGITWMVWGMAIGGIFLSFAVAGSAFSDAYPFWAFFLWAPWTFVGAVTTVHLWRSTRLIVVFDVRRTFRRVVLAIAVALGSVYLAFGLGAWVLRGHAGGFLAYVGLGAAAVAFAGIGFPSRERAPRLALATVGGLLGILGLSGGYLLRGSNDDAMILTFTLFSSIAAALMCVGAGVYLAGRQ